MKKYRIVQTENEDYVLQIFNPESYTYKDWWGWFLIITNSLFGWWEEICRDKRLDYVKNEMAAHIIQDHKEKLRKEQLIINQKAQNKEEIKRHKVKRIL